MSVFSTFLWSWKWQTAECVLELRICKSQQPVTDWRCLAICAGLRCVGQSWANDNLDLVNYSDTSNSFFVCDTLHFTLGKYLTICCIYIHCTVGNSSKLPQISNFWSLIKLLQNVVFKYFSNWSVYDLCLQHLTLSRVITHH